MDALNPLKVVNISKKTFSTIKRGMYRVVNGEKGPAKAAYCRNIRIAGKTGTAENPHGDPHSWFVGFAPFNKPEIAVCVLVENGGSGGKIAAPIAREIIKSYYHIFHLDKIHYQNNY